MFICSVSPALPCVMLHEYNSVKPFIHINTSVYPIEFKLNSFQLKRISLFHKVQLDNEHSFKYTHKNIVAWGEPLVIFPSLFFPGWKHVYNTGTTTTKSTVVTLREGLSHTSCEMFSAKRNIPFRIKLNKKEREAQTELMCPKCVCHFRHNTYNGVHKTKQNVMTTTCDHLW